MHNSSTRTNNGFKPFSRKVNERNAGQTSFGYDMETDYEQTKQWEGMYEHTDGSHAGTGPSDRLVTMVQNLKKAMQSATERI
jgi:hypothetical protein